MGRVQPGGRVDETVYDRFTDYVEDKHGSLRGNLGRELTKAMENRMSGGNGEDQLTRIENDIATLKARLAEAEADGGEVIAEPPRTPDSDETTHTHRSGGDPPHPRATTREKAEWVADRVVSDCDSGQIHAEYDVGRVVDDTYGFDDEPREKLISAAIDLTDFVEHPGEKTDEVYVTEERAEEFRENMRSEAAEQNDELDDAERGE